MRRHKKRSSPVNDLLGQTSVSVKMLQEKRTCLFALGKSVAEISKYCLFYRDYDPESQSPLANTRTASAFSLRRIVRGSSRIKRSGTSQAFPMPSPSARFSSSPARTALQGQGCTISVPRPPLMDLVFHNDCVFCLRPACICNKHIETTLGTGMDSPWLPRGEGTFPGLLFFRNWWVGSINHFKKLPPSNRFEQFVQSLYRGIYV